MSDEKMSTDDAFRYLVSLATAIGILMLSTGGMVFMLSRSGCVGG
mgnify:CR=1 FL=1